MRHVWLCLLGLALLRPCAVDLGGKPLISDLETKDVGPKVSKNYLTCAMSGFVSVCVSVIGYKD